MQTTDVKNFMANSDQQWLNTKAKCELKDKKWLQQTGHSQVVC